MDLIGNAPSVALIGMCKNAGKTTTLNRLVYELAGDGRRTALTSVGRDGETTDLVTGTAKPSVWMRRGMLCATAADLLPYCDASRELLEVTDYTTPLGAVVIFQARSDGFVQLAGPSMVAQLRPLCERLARLGAAVTLVDGALNRRSPVAGTPGGCCVLCTGASCGKDLRQVVEDTAYVYRLLTLPEAEPEPPDSPKGRFVLTMADGLRLGVEDRETLAAHLKAGAVRRLHLRGALTDSLAASLTTGGAMDDGFQVSVENSGKLLLGRAQFTRLTARGAVVEVIDPSRVAAVTINPVSAYGWQFDKEEFLTAMAEAVPAPVLNVEELYHETEL